MARAEAPLSRMTNCPTNGQGRPTPEGMQQNGHHLCLWVEVEDLRKQ